MKNSITRRALMTIAACSAASGAVWAQEKPPVRIIIPASAGSGVDTQIRAITTPLSKTLGQSVVVENLAGAGGVSGTQQIVRANADGNTLGVVSNNHAVNPAVFKKMPFDSLKDITPICVVGSTPFVLVVNPKLPVKSLKEFQALLKLLNHNQN